MEERLRSMDTPMLQVSDEPELGAPGIAPIVATGKA